MQREGQRDKEEENPQADSLLSADLDPRLIPVFQSCRVLVSGSRRMNLEDTKEEVK